MKAYDLDGVIADTPPKKKKHLTKDEIKERYSQAYPLIDPIPPYIIITARKPEYCEITQEWIKKHGINPPLIIEFMSYPRTKNNMIRHKREKICEHKITEFYEDDPVIAKKLKQICNKVYIVEKESC